MENRVMKMKDRPAAERPYEKCAAGGPSVLTDGELLAVILRCGTKNQSALELAWEVLGKHPAYKGLEGLHHMDVNMLMEISGIGRVKAIELLCVIELSKRLARTQAAERPDFSSPENIASYYMEEMRHLDRERVLLLLLNRRFGLLKEMILSSGSADSAFVSVKHIFMEALRHDASNLILLHNHPSGCPEPSREDILLTKRVKEAGELLGIPLKDHIIIGDQSFSSMKGCGVL